METMVRRWCRSGSGSGGSVGGGGDDVVYGGGGRDDDGGGWVPAAVGRKISPEMGAAPENGGEKTRL
ncbi:hypothetical protein Tco_1526094, partial [Tanacetum coccineum]